MALDISGISFFMPVFGFLFVFLVVYAILLKSKIFGDIPFAYFLVSFAMSVIFMSFSSLELYVRTIIPWFVILFIIVFLVLLIAGFSTKSLDKIMTSKFAWFIVAVLVIIFLIAAIRVFNPIFHPDLVIASGEGTSLGEQVKGFFGSSKWAGSLLLFLIAAVVAWFISKK